MAHMYINGNCYDTHVCQWELLWHTCMSMGTVMTHIYVNGNCYDTHIRQWELFLTHMYVNGSCLWHTYMSMGISSQIHTVQDASRHSANHPLEVQWTWAGKNSWDFINKKTAVHKGDTVLMESYAWTIRADTTLLYIIIAVWYTKGTKQCQCSQSRGPGTLGKIYSCPKPKVSNLTVYTLLHMSVWAGAQGPDIPYAIHYRRAVQEGSAVKILINLYGEPLGIWTACRLTARPSAW